MSEPLAFAGIEWHWRDEPARWTVPSPDQLTVVAAGGSRWFVNPGDPTDIGSHAPALLGLVPGDFQLSAVVDVQGPGVFDAGALVIFRDEHTWAKICVENSPGRIPMLVSVVTRGPSDDCNHLCPLLTATSARLRLARTGLAYAVHVSHDERTWSLLRHFSLGPAAPDSSPDLVGFQAQSPRGSGATVTFSEIAVRRSAVEDIRGGG